MGLIICAAQDRVHIGKGYTLLDGKQGILMLMLVMATRYTSTNARAVITSVYGDSVAWMLMKTGFK